MEIEDRLTLMAVSLRGICATHCKTMQFIGCEDTMNGMWRDLDPAVRAKWLSFCELVLTLFSNDVFHNTDPDTLN